MTRLMQSGLIDKQDLPRKYKHELHANEIVLLAYYIAAVNIENAYHDQMGETSEYTPFEGIVLTDTFQLGETGESNKLFSEMFPQNSDRVVKQKKAALRVIIGNPPYSVGQRSANDNAQNQKYDFLDNRIANTYAKESTATLQNSLYNSYIKAFRWSTDRLDPIHGGVIAFVSNGSWLDGNAQDGFRKVVEREFSSIWVFNLRGNQRTSGELSRREGGKIFGSGSRNPIAITLLVKNPAVKTTKAVIHYHDIGDYLSREEKLAIINKFVSVANPAMKWDTLHPDEHGNWISQGSNVFGTLIPMGNKEDKSVKTFFVPNYGRGLATSRDSWCYNSSKSYLENNIRSSIEYFNEKSRGFKDAKSREPNLQFDEFIIPDSTKFSWDRAQKFDLQKFKQYEFNSVSVTKSVYRPFNKQWVYFNRRLNNCVYQLPSNFPEPSSKNLVICVPGAGENKNFSVLISDCIPDLHLIGAVQAFPLYYYEQQDKQSPTLWDVMGETEYIRRDGVSDFILDRAKKQYGKNVSKEDIFYYVYGILHSPEYRTTFANDLRKTLPRIPLVEDVRDFWKFSKTGRQLAGLHVDYEKVPPYESVKGTGADSKFYTVEKMRFPQKGQKDSIIYNSKITLTHIPPRAYEYVVNGKSAIEWIIERYQVTVHPESGIKNDPNDWADEVGNPRYILDLLLSVINVSVQTVDMVEGLPKIKFE